MHYVVGYRKEVMYSNLKRAFPEKTDAEIKAIMKGAYRNLTDITLETIKGFTMPIEEVQKRCVSVNPEFVKSTLDSGQSILLAGSHYNTWEWTGLIFPIDLKVPIICSYKPLSNQLVNDYYNKRRERTGMQMYSMQDTYAAFRKNQDVASTFILVADQSPSSKKSAHWVDFLGIQSAFVPGLDFLSRKFQYPVYYFHVDRVKRGYYQITYELVHPNPAAADNMEVTRAYAQLVEKHIREEPANWLWSHKRWKIAPPV
jgi:KDO2-lipid IV(A) lauroyltransferase